MPTLRIYDYWEVTDISGAEHRGGSRTNPVEIEVAGYVDHATLSLATDTSLSLWTSAGTLANFDFFWLVSDVDLKLELTVDSSGDVGSEEIVVLVEAGTPFRLIFDDALALYTGTLSGGQADVVDEIVCRNESGSTATIERVLIT